ncbi:MAG: hypothetical protein OEV21_00425 [Thermoplasmata archaeon]|nr:hypothetical protein [Thermoplasmata archaeon]
MIGDEIIGLFEAIGALGLVISFAIISFLDGFAIPTLPEAWLILIAISDTGVPKPIWALTLILVGTSAAVSAQALLYCTIKRVGLPRRLKGWMTRYTKFLIVSDEKLAFMNWLAPVVPFTGAFIAVCGWRARRAFIYSIMGGLIKMTIIVGIAVAFPLIFSPDMVADASLVLILAVLGLSLTITYLRRRMLSKKMTPEDASKCQLDDHDAKTL